MVSLFFSVIFYFFFFDFVVEVLLNVVLFIVEVIFNFVVLELLGLSYFLMVDFLMG